jgi:hypothetical protein
MYIEVTWCFETRDLTLCYKQNVFENKRNYFNRKRDEIIDTVKQFFNKFNESLGNIFITYWNETRNAVKSI